MSSLSDRFFKLPVYVHLLSVAALFCAVVYITLLYVDSYTNHNQAVIVPEVKGLQVEEAAPYFGRNFLRYTVIDSVYSKDAKPGAIVELTPEANSKVKRNRIVYITVNARTEETVSVPGVADMSYRQAYALLKSRGFANVEIKYVTSEFRDLAICVEHNGKALDEGARLPLSSKIVLVLGNGNIALNDSIDSDRPVIIGGDESWF